jgi:peptide/nickel transport system substrate-binding protein
MGPSHGKTRRDARRKSDDRPANAFDEWPCRHWKRLRKRTLSADRYRSVRIRDTGEWEEKMKRCCVPATLLVILALIILGGTPSTAAQGQKKTPPRTVAAKPATVANDPQPDPRVTRGGILKATRSRFPKVIGYVPEMGPIDGIYAQPIAERFVEWDERGNSVPVLAESWTTDPQAKTVTFHLRKGVRFQDGTPFNAEAAKWNMQVSLEGGKLPDRQSVKSIDVVDEYTIRVTLTDFTNMAVLNYGASTPMFSPTAFQKNGGKEWARTHAVGTGPFKLVDFKRDTFIKYERNGDYWRKGFPYLDGMEIRFVPDPMTASMLLESRDSDLCLDGLTMKNVVDLEKKGLKINWGPGMLWSILPNSKDPKSPYANKKVREAIEYAIDRTALTRMLGFGKYEAVTQIVPSASPAYVAGFNPRPYNPAKARQLLTEAGYPNGFDTKLLIYDLAIMRDTATALQSFLAAVGIRLTIDLADIGRYSTSIFSPTGWSDLALVQSGINPAGTDVFAHFGPKPFTFRFGNPAKSPEYLDLAEKALKTFEPKAANAALKQVVRKAGEDAMTVPLFRASEALVMQPYVHTEYLKIHIVTWFVYKDWMEKRK